MCLLFSAITVFAPCRKPLCNDKKCFERHRMFPQVNQTKLNHNSEFKLQACAVLMQHCHGFYFHKPWQHATSLRVVCTVLYDTTVSSDKIPFFRPLQESELNQFKLRVLSCSYFHTVELCCNGHSFQKVDRTLY